MDIITHMSKDYEKLYDLICDDKEASAMRRLFSYLCN